jgi:hypothetical protein
MSAAGGFVVMAAYPTLLNCPVNERLSEKPAPKMRSNR